MLPGKRKTLSFPFSTVEKMFYGSFFKKQNKTSDTSLLALPCKLRLGGSAPPLPPFLESLLLHLTVSGHVRSVSPYVSLLKPSPFMVLFLYS